MKTKATRKKISECSIEELQLALEQLKGEQESLDYSINKISNAIFSRHHPELTYDDIDITIDINP